MLACNGGNSDTKDSIGITISPKEDEIPANGATRFIAYNAGSRQRANVRWSSLDREAGFENDFGLTIDSTTGVVSVDQTIGTPEKTGSTVKILATSSTDSGKTDNALVTVHPAIKTEAKSVTIRGLSLDRFGAPRAFPGENNARILQATVEWADGYENDETLEYWFEKGTANSVYWEIEGENAAGTGINPESGMFIVDANETAEFIYITAISKLTGKKSDKLKVRIVSGEIDSIVISVVNSLTGKPEYDLKVGGEGQLRIKATIEAAGNIGSDAIFEVRAGDKVLGRPTAELTQVRTLPRDEYTSTTGLPEEQALQVTEAVFSSVRTESNKTIEIIARAQANPLFEDSRAMMTVDLNGYDGNESQDWRIIRMGRDHVIAVAAGDNGGIFTWGSNQGGQLGYILPNDASGNDAESSKHALFIDSRPSNHTPTEVEFKGANKLATTDRWSQISGGHTYSMALSEQGRLFMWGVITSFRGEQPSSSSQNDPRGKRGATSMVLRSYGDLDKGNTDLVEEIPMQGGSEWVFISAGHSTAFAINKAGELYSWGLGNNGKLGYEISGQLQKDPKIVANTSSVDGKLIPWTSVAAGETQAYGIKQDGTLWAWGSNDYGQLGMPRDGQIYTTPQQVIPFDLKGGAWRQIVAGADHAAALDMRGNLYTWGRVNNNGKGGDNKKADGTAGLAWDFSKPGKNQDIEGKSLGTAFALIAAHATETTLAITNNGRLMLFGWDSYGQLNAGRTEPNYGATTTTSYGEGINWMPINLADDNADDLGNSYTSGDGFVIDNLWSSIVVGGSTALGIQRDGQLWMWGHTQWAQNGNGKVPVKVPGSDAHQIQPVPFLIKRAAN